MKKPILLILLICLVITIIYISSTFLSWRQDVIKYNQTSTVEANKILSEISKKVGINFINTLALREYVYCELLRKGMNRSEINNSISQIGQIKPFDSQIDFIDSYLYYNLSPIMLEFDSPSMDGELLKWYASTESNLGAPRAWCELNN